jgi:hypothetical protein
MIAKKQNVDEETHLQMETDRDNDNDQDNDIFLEPDQMQLQNEIRLGPFVVNRCHGSYAYENPATVQIDDPFKPTTGSNALSDSVNSTPLFSSMTSSSSTTSDPCVVNSNDINAASVCTNNSNSESARFSHDSDPDNITITNIINSSKTEKSESKRAKAIIDSEIHSNDWV